MSEHLMLAKCDGVLTVKIKGNFDEDLVEEFRTIYGQINSNDNTIVLDLSAAQQIDCAALGVMIQLRKTLSDSSIEHIMIVNCNQHIRKVFEVMRFEYMFEIP